MRNGELDIEAQHVVLMEMLALARRLHAQGDAFLDGHYLHIRERIETVLAIMETDVLQIPAGG